MKYGIVYESDIFDNLNDAGKKCEQKGTQLKYKIFALGEEFEVELTSIVRKITKKPKLKESNHD